MNEYVYVAMIIALGLLVALFFSGFGKGVTTTLKTIAEKCNLPNMVKEKNGKCICNASKGYYPTFFDPYDQNKKDEIFNITRVRFKEHY